MNQTGIKKITIATVRNNADIISCEDNQDLKPAPTAKVATSHSTNHSMPIKLISRWKLCFDLINSFLVMARE
jgi:hypothetical protein